MGVLDQKVAIVTGSARGIGKATAEILSQNGARVAVCDLDVDLAEETARRLASECVVYGGDLTKERSAAELVKTAIDAWGRLDIVVNNAGYTWDGAIHKMSDEQFNAMLEVHTVAPFRVLRAAAPHLREPAKLEREAGREVFRKIVNVSSISGTMGNAGQANYASAKAGVVGLTKTLAKEWGPLKINVNAVAFGYVDTRLTAERDRAGQFDKDGRAIQLGVAPGMRELGDSHHPARAAGASRGGSGPGVLPLLAVVGLRQRAGAQRDRWPVGRNGLLT